MKLTLPGGRVVETSDPSHRFVLLALQEALEGFRQAAEAIPEDTAHAAHAELSAEARAAAERAVHAFDAMREVLLGLGVDAPTVDAFAAGAMRDVRSFLGEAAPTSPA